MKAGYVPCADCCTCPAPTVLAATVSASKTKCGFDEFVTPSSPPKKYLTMTPACSLTYLLERYFCQKMWTCLEGAIGSRDEIEAELTGDASVSFDPVTCVQSGEIGSQSRHRLSAVPDFTVDCTLVVGAWENWVENGWQTGRETGREKGLIEQALGAYLNGYDSSSCCSSVQTPTTLTQTGIPCRETSCPGDLNAYETWAGSYSLTLSDEYTTTALIANVIAALPSWPSFTATAGSPVSSYTLATDQLSFTVERSKYKFRFKVPKVGNGSCYKLTWVERTTLTPSATITDVPKTFTWNGTAAGYDATDPTTWPHTGEYEIDEPASNGETVIGYYTDPTDHTTFVQEYILAECRGCA